VFGLLMGTQLISEKEVRSFTISLSTININNKCADACASLNSFAASAHLDRVQAP